jgi:hypothetical protein
MTFGNQSILAHLVRGALGFGSLVLALRGYDVIGWPALPLMGITVWMLKGCPICWAIGLAESVAFKFLRRSEQLG